MLIALLFWILCLAACGYAILLGGWEGKVVTVIVLVSTIATVVALRPLDTHWYTTNHLMMAVDVTTFLALFLVAARSRRWWPVWFAAFQLNTLAAHVATMLSPSFSALVYRGYEGLWAIPCLLAMIFGIYLDRERMTDHGAP